MKDHHNLVIEIPKAKSEQLRRYWQRMVDGLSEYNAEWLADHPEAQDGPFPTYELPRSGGRCADQRVASAPIILERNKATCVEWACFVTGLYRLRGETEAYVRLIPIFSETYGRAVPYQYHAVVVRADGTIEDVTADLPGYNLPGPWWKAAGHCCADCALGKHGPVEPCEPCAEGH